MARLVIRLGAVGGVLMLGACGLGDYSVPNPEDGAVPGAVGLIQGYAVLGADETGRYDWSDARYFNEKASRAATARGVMPQDPYERDLPVASLMEIYDSYERLREAIYRDGRAVAPEPMARAQVMYDCWLEEAEEGQGDETTCRAGFLSAMEEVEVALDRGMPMAAAPMPGSLVYTVYFDFDSAELRQDAREVLASVASDIDALPSMPARIVVSGYTDSAGTSAYNQALAERRARAVQSGLIAAGVPADLVQIRNYGETEPEVQTGDDKPEPLNRRVIIEVVS